jgi:hypothetical protein
MGENAERLLKAIFEFPFGCSGLLEARNDEQ